MADRIATITGHLRTLNSITGVQSSLAKVTQQISSGKKAQTYSELNGVVERVVGNESKLARIDNYITNNKSTSARLQVMNTSLTQVQKVLEDFASNLTTRNSAVTSNQMNFQGLAQDKLDKLKSALNVSVQGSYIFSGTKSDVKPIGSGNFAISEYTGMVKQTYYQGNSEIVSARISDDQEISYGITADNEAFQQIITAIVKAIETDQISPQGGDFSESFDLINQAKETLASLRANVNFNMTSVDAANADQESLKLYWKEALRDDVDTDIAEASIRLAADQTVLQATYQTFALTSKLKLTDYL